MTKDSVDGLEGGEELPSDYEACGDCGYDHSYEQNEARMAHDRMNVANAAADVLASLIRKSGCRK